MKKKINPAYNIIIPPKKFLIEAEKIFSQAVDKEVVEKVMSGLKAVFNNPSDKKIIISSLFYVAKKLGLVSLDEIPDALKDLVVEIETAIFFATRKQKTLRDILVGLNMSYGFKKFVLKDKLIDNLREVIAPNFDGLDEENKLFVDAMIIKAFSSFPLISFIAYEYTIPIAFWRRIKFLTLEEFGRYNYIYNCVFYQGSRRDSIAFIDRIIKSHRKAFFLVPFFPQQILDLKFFKEFPFANLYFFVQDHPSFGRIHYKISKNDFDVLVGRMIKTKKMKIEIPREYLEAINTEFKKSIIIQTAIALLEGAFRLLSRDESLELVIKIIKKVLRDYKRIYPRAQDFGVIGGSVGNEGNAQKTQEEAVVVA